MMHQNARGPNPMTREQIQAACREEARSQLVHSWQTLAKLLSEAPVNPSKLGPWLERLAFHTLIIHHLRPIVHSNDPVDAIRKLKADLEDDLLHGRYRHKSTCPFTNAVDDAKHEWATRFRISYLTSLASLAADAPSEVDVEVTVTTTRTTDDLETETEEA